MPKIAYIEKAFRPDSLDMIATCNRIIADYMAQGYDLTLRQLYYQLVARDIIENSDRSYKRLGDLINNARLAGLVDWYHITDRTRNLRSNSHWAVPGEIIKSAADSYALDKWVNQPFRVEVWVEKDALVGVVGRICSRLDVPYFSCRGYTSQSEMWSGARRIQRHADYGQTPVILHLGDHDPSGRDMSRDIADRMELFMGGVTFNRLALNYNQIEQYNPPPNPAKITDSRASAYIAEFGRESWELDALEPSIISDLIEQAVIQFRDDDLWDAAVERETSERALLANAASRWSDIRDFLLESDEEGDDETYN